MRDKPVAEVSTIKTHNIPKRQTSMPPTGFKAAIPASEEPQNQALERAATCIDSIIFYNIIFQCSPNAACRFRLAQSGDMRY